MKQDFLEKVRAFDPNTSVRKEIDNAMELLSDFRAKYPFAENPQKIEDFSPDDIFKEQTDEVGDFFHWLEYYLKPIGHLTIYGSNVYRDIRRQFEDFKDLLYVVVDKDKSLAQKVDAPWGEITHLGGDEHIAKKIIFCFNYESQNVLPIFKTEHLKYFVSEIVEQPSPTARYYSLGEKYEYLTSELLKVKNGLQKTQSWPMPYFSRFLYDVYPPSLDKIPNDSKRIGKTKIEIGKEQLDFGEFVKLLGTLQRQGKLSGAEFIRNRELWREHPQDREAITQRLKNMLK